MIEPEMPLDAGIARAVRLINEAGMPTYESCEGGEGHAFPDPTVRFNASYPEALRAVAVLLAWHLPVAELRHVWRMTDSALEGPWWDITFSRKLEREGGPQG